MRVTGGTPNIINGVSRQPPEVRLTSQLEESVNQLPTISRGLVKRNPAMLEGVISGAAPANSKVHLIDRDDKEQYVVTMSPSGVAVHGLDGTPKTVNAPGGFAYLSGATKESLEALTVLDHTFILNKDRTVAKGAQRTPAAAKEGLIHVVQGDYFTDYKIIINGAVKAHWTTDGGPYEVPYDARRAERGAKTSVISQLLAHGRVAADAAENSLVYIVRYANERYQSGTNNEGDPIWSYRQVPVYDQAVVGHLHSSLNNTLPSTEWAVTVIDNVIHIKNKLGNDFTLEVEAGSETRIRAHKGQSKDFSELPRKAPDGFRLKIAGDEDTGYDDYYVAFKKDADSAQGVWEEVAAPDIQYRIDASTMPHLLVREADGTFTFKPAEWADREVGDDDTNPWPSFVGQKINGMAFDNNRIGLHSGESLAQSRNGEFFNFWIESILAPVDTDPVDAAISYPDVSTIYHVVPFAGETVLFTSSVPFRLASGDNLTQKTVRYEHLATNPVSPKVRPVSAGERLYFISEAPSGSFVYEMAYDRAVDSLRADSITDHVPGYIPYGVTLMAADDDLKALVMVSEEDPTVLYVYKWLVIGQDKVQSAWQKWAVDARIVALRFYDERLVLVTDRGNSREVLSINCHEAWKQDDPVLLCIGDALVTSNGMALSLSDSPPAPVYLDRQMSADGAYDPASDTTVFQVPYAGSEGVTAIDRTTASYGAQLSIVSTGPNEVRVAGRHDLSLVSFGFNYESYGELSPLLHRAANNQGGYGNALPGFETTIGNIRFGLGDTAFLTLSMGRDYRQPYTKVISAARTGTKTGSLGALVTGRPPANLSVLAKSSDVSITFGSDGPHPYSVLSYSWTGDARQISF